jgi:acetylglutamate kinase
VVTGAGVISDSPVTAARKTPHVSAPKRTGTIVLKLGGRALEAEGAWCDLARDIQALETPPVVVHGGGAEVTEWCRRMGIEPRFVDGLRVTDDATLEVVAAVLAGLANKRLVATLRTAGVDAIGLAAMDGGVIEVAPHPDAATLGHVARVRAVNPGLIGSLLARGAVPVLASVSQHQGQLMNLNADDAAAALAGALGAAALVLLSDTPGVRLAGSTVEHLDVHALERALVHPEVRDGMRPKLHAARVALEAGVPHVYIARWEGAGTLARLLAGESLGTHVTGLEESQ